MNYDEQLAFSERMETYRNWAEFAKQFAGEVEVVGDLSLVDFFKRVVKVSDKALDFAGKRAIGITLPLVNKRYYVKSMFQFVSPFEEYETLLSDANWVNTIDVDTFNQVFMAVTGDLTYSVEEWDIYTAADQGQISLHESGIPEINVGLTLSIQHFNHELGHYEYLINELGDIITDPSSGLDSEFGSLERIVSMGMDVNKVTVVFAAGEGGQKRKYARVSVLNGAPPADAAEEATRIGKVAEAAWTMFKDLFDAGVLNCKPLFVKGFQSLSQTLDGYDPDPDATVASLKGFWYSAASTNDTVFRRWSAVKCTLPLLTTGHTELTDAISGLVSDTSAKCLGRNRDTSAIELATDPTVTGYWITGREDE